MHVPLLEALGGSRVLLCGEADQPLLAKIDFQGVEGGDDDIYTEVELEAVDEQWILDVALHHTSFL